MPLEGDLETMAVAELLGWLARRRATGQLTMTQGMVARRFHLRNGRVMLASSTEEGHLLGRMLIEEGLIEADHLAGVLGSRSESMTRARLGKELVEAGLVSADDIALTLTRKVHRLLADALTWRAGRFHFDEAEPVRRRAAVSTTVDLAEFLEERGLPVKADPPRSPPGRGRVWTVTDDDVIEIRPLEERRVGPRRGKSARGLPPAAA
jgi:Domain of unknown function (DUF4388)